MPLLFRRGYIIPGPPRQSRPRAGLTDSAELHFPLSPCQHHRDLGRTWNDQGRYQRHASHAGGVRSDAMAKSPVNYANRALQNAHTAQKHGTELRRDRRLHSTTGMNQLRHTQRPLQLPTRPLRGHINRNMLLQKLPKSTPGYLTTERRLETMTRLLIRRSTGASRPLTITAPTLANAPSSSTALPPTSHSCSNFIRVFSTTGVPDSPMDTEIMKAVRVLTCLFNGLSSSARLHLLMLRSLLDLPTPSPLPAPRCSWRNSRP